MKKWKLIRVALAVGILAGFSNVIAEKNDDVNIDRKASEFQQQFIQTQVRF